MKKIVLPIVLGVSLLTGCTNNNEKDTTESTSVSETLSLEKLDVGGAKTSLDDKSFSISGSADPSATINISLDGEIVKSFSPEDDGSFLFIGEIHDLDDLTYSITDGDTTHNIKIKSIQTLENEEEQREKAAKERALEAERKKAEEEKKKEEDEANKEKEEEQAKKDDDLVKRVEAIQNATREEHNALTKAEDYLKFTAFSKSGLQDQLIFEGFPDETAKFAVEHIKVDWNDQALKKAIQYLDFSSFSDQGLYDQLIYEGFTPDQAQHAIDNLPD